MFSLHKEGATRFEFDLLELAKLGLKPRGKMHLFGVPSYTGRRSQRAVVIPAVDASRSSCTHFLAKSKQTCRHGNIGLPIPEMHFGRNKEQSIKLLCGEQRWSRGSMTSRSFPFDFWNCVPNFAVIL